MVCPGPPCWWAFTPRFIMNSSTTCFSPRVVHGLLLCLSLLAVTGCDRSEAEASAAKGVRPAPRAMPVLVQAVEPANIPILIQVVGQAEGSKSVEIRPRVNGIIEQITFQDGEKIAPLSMNQVRICQANGYRFDVTNTVGCAKTVDSELAVKL